jgi:hypothetical protein
MAAAARVEEQIRLGYEPPTIRFEERKIDEK